MLKKPGHQNAVRNISNYSWNNFADDKCNLIKNNTVRHSWTCRMAHCYSIIMKNKLFRKRIHLTGDSTYPLFIPTSILYRSRSAGAYLHCQCKEKQDTQGCKFIFHFYYGNSMRKLSATYCIILYWNMQYIVFRSYWLPFNQDIPYKMFILTYKALLSQYLTDLLHTQTLRSSHIPQLTATCSRLWTMRDLWCLEPWILELFAFTHVTLCFSWSFQVSSQNPSFF